MRFTFLSHQWLAFSRSRGKTGTIATRIILGLVMLYLVAVAVLIGYSMEELIGKLLPGREVRLVFNGMILYYFAIEFVIRLQLQELPTLAVVPYLHLNISKRKILNFLHLSALFSAFNLIPVFLFFPYCLLHISRDSGSLTCFVYLLSIISLTVFNNYGALFIKRISALNMSVVIAGLLILSVAGSLEYFQVYSIATCSDRIFRQLSYYPALGLIFPLLAGGIFLLNDRFLKNNLYLEELRTSKEKIAGTDYPFLHRFGEAGTLAALEIKLILRNKRPKAVVMKGLLFLVYGFLFYKPHVIAKNEFGIMLFPAIFITGNTIFMYGQFMFSWQSAELDGLLANRISIRAFFKAKLILLSLSAAGLTLLTSFYVWVSWKILLVNLIACLYNIGVSTIIVLYAATLNNKAIDISKASRFNWQGVTAATMLLSVPFLLSPYLIYFPLSLISPVWGLTGVAAAGVAALLSRNFWLSVLVKSFHKRKYKIAAGFRERT